MIGMDSVKLLMNWDIKQGQDHDYFEFVMREWVPGVTKLGMEPSGAWYTVYSRENDTPQILAEGIVEDLEKMQDILQSNEWSDLQDRLLTYVENYEHKVVRVSGGFQF